jgi:hypothetical protein
VRFRAAAAVAAIIAVVGIPTLGAVGPASAADPAAIAVTAAPAGFGVVRSGQPIRLFVTIDDQVGNGLAAGTATVTTSPAPSTSRDDLSDWFDGSAKASLASAKIGSTPTPALLPGESRVVPITIAAKAAHLGAAGVYKMALTLTAGGKTIGASRTAISWTGGSSTSVPIALAAPLTVPAANETFISAKALATYTAPGGILTDELDQVQDKPVAIGIDPRILASIRILGRSAPQTALDWLTRLEAVSNETFPLAWADADLTAALQAGSKTVPVLKPLDFAIDPGLFQTPDTSGTTPTPTPTLDPANPPLPTSASLVAFNYTLPQLSWPADDSLVASDAQGLAASGITSVILSSSNVKRAASRTPLGAATTVSTLAAYVSDSDLSTYLRQAAATTTRPQFTAAMARLAAASDLLSRESGSTAPIMLATLGRGWETDDTFLLEAIDGLYSLPWISPGALDQIAAAAPTKAVIAPKPQSAARIALVHSMLSNESHVDQFAEVTAPDQEQLTSTRRLLLLSLLSDEWFDDQTAWQKQAEGYVTASRKIVDSVAPVESSTVTLLNDRVSLPIVLSNNLDQAVTVYIAVRPRTTQLTVDEAHRLVEVRIPANSQHRAEVPVQSVANGKVDVRVALYSKSGLRIGPATIIRVNVQAGWETIGTLIFGALVVAIFAIGIFRTIRKRRRGLDDAGVEGLDDEAEPGARSGAAE